MSLKTIEVPSPGKWSDYSRLSPMPADDADQILLKKKSKSPKNRDNNTTATDEVDRLANSTDSSIGSETSEDGAVSNGESRMLRELSSLTVTSTAGQEKKEPECRIAGCWVEKAEGEETHISIYETAEKTSNDRKLKAGGVNYVIVMSLIALFISFAAAARLVFHQDAVLAGTKNDQPKNIKNKKQKRLTLFTRLDIVEAAKIHGNHIPTTQTIATPRLIQDATFYADTLLLKKKKKTKNTVASEKATSKETRKVWSAPWALKPTKHAIF